MFVVLFSSRIIAGIDEPFYEEQGMVDCILVVLTICKYFNVLFVTKELKCLYKK